MHDCQKITLKDKVANTIRKFNLINPGDKIVLGVSGGPDSMCMLDILLKLQKENNSIFTNCQEGRSKKLPKRYVPSGKKLPKRYVPLGKFFGGGSRKSPY